VCLIYPSQFKGSLQKLEGTPATANKALGALRAMLDWGTIFMDDKVKTNVAAQVKKLAEDSDRSDVTWSRANIEYAVGKLPEYYTDVMLLSLYTGARLGDVVSWQRKNVTPQQLHGTRWLVYIPNKTHKKKKRLKICVPIDLLPPLATLIDKLYARCASKNDYLCRNKDGRQIIAKRFSTNYLASLKLHCPELADLDLHFHDLRGTMNSRLMECAGPTEAAVVLGHSIKGIQKNYTRRAPLYAIKAFKALWEHLQHGTPEITAEDLLLGLEEAI
jgi:integrase